MSSETGVLDPTFDEIIESVFEDSDEIRLVNPAPEVFRSVMLTVSEFEDELPDLQVLAVSDVLKAAVEDFILASQIADLVDQETLSLRSTADISQNSLFISENEVAIVVTLDSEITALNSTEKDFVEKMQAAFLDEWEEGDDFSLRTPPLSRVKETLAEEFGEDVQEDFLMMLEEADTVPGENDQLDEVAIALLVGANNGELLYNISKWGEDTGLASKATFSRTKTQLEDRDIIETEKVPIEVGRPRLRLLLIPESLEDINSIPAK